MRLLIFVLVLLSLTQPKYVHSTTNYVSALDQVVADTANAANAGALLNVQGCEVSYLKAKGLANRQTKQPMPVDEQLRIASVGKLYTAAVIHQLILAGKLELDRPLDSYLPTDTLAGIDNTDATIEQLLNHTSGIPDYYDWRSYLFWDWKEPLTTDRVLRVAKRRSATGKPGQAYAYSNTNYHLLALVAEHITGKPLSTLIETSILQPNNLHNTSYNTQHPGGSIHGYGTILRPWADTWGYAENTGPDSGITASASDLGKMLGILFNQQEPPNQIGAAMLSALVPTGKANQLATAGAEILVGRDGLRLIGHTGDTFGYLTFAFAIPQYNVTIVGHINKNDSELLISFLAGTVRVLRQACGV